MPPRSRPGRSSRKTRLSGLEAGRDPAARQRLRQRRRADERHRLAEVREAHPRGPLRRGRRGRPPAGRGRRPAHRREHGRGDARLGGGDVALPATCIATEPDISAVPVMIDSSKWSVIEAGLQVRPGQGRRELDLAQGGRGGRSSSTPRLVPPLRRRGRRHGLRRAGPGRHRRAQGRDRAPGLRPADASRPASRRRTSSSTRTSSRSATGIEEHAELRGRLHRGDAADQGRAARVPASRAACRTCRSRSAATTRSARRSTAVFLYHAIAAGMDMGIVNAGAAGDLRRHRPGAARARRGRRAQPPARRHGAAARGRGQPLGARARRGERRRAWPGASGRSTSG